MTSIRKLLLAPFLVLCFSAYSNAQQIDSTGNLINNNNWSGVTYGVDPNDCCSNPAGSNPLYDTATDTIKWSYGQVTVQQGWAVNQALQGTGIQVHGYNYQYDIRNMNGDGNQNGIDTMVVNTWLKNSAGQVILGNSAVYNIQFDWTTIGNTMTLNSPMPTSDLGTAGISFASRDGGFWAGLYGPEIRNVSFSLNYSFDPCAADPLYSSSCPGYWEAWFAQLCLFWCPTSSPEPEIEVASVDYTLVPSTTSSMSMPEETTTGEVKVDAGGIEVTTTGELQVPDGIPEEAREKKPVDMNLIMSIVREATDDSKALAVVNQSIQDSMAEDANPDFSGTNEALAAIREQSQKSQEIEITIDTSSQLETTSMESVSNNIMQQTEMQMSDTQQDIVVTDTIRKDNDTETEALAIVERNMPPVDTNKKEEKEERVNRNVEPNEAASGSDIASLAVSPIGFDDYLTKSLTDARFYQDKEIYSGQAVVDNRRAQRLLNGASDRLHREMVDQQYRRQ